MALVNRAITHSKASFIAWLCCFPCNIIGALCCMACGKCEKAVECACGPCLDETLGKMAGSVATYALSGGLFGAQHHKLLALKTAQWDSTYLFGFGAIRDDLHSTLYREIRQAVVAIFDVYNFGTIKSEDLTEDELKLIGTELRDAILSHLPSKEEFDRDVNANKIAPDNSAALNGYLAGLIMTIIGGDFIKNELNRISDDIELKRAGGALVAAQVKVSMFRGLNAGQHTNVLNASDQPLQEPQIHLT